MSYSQRESSTYQGQPWECYWFSCGPDSWRLTSGDVPRTLGGYVYEPTPLLRTEIEQCQELRSGQIKVTLPIDHPVAQLFRSGLTPRPVSLVLYRGHDGDAEMVTSFPGDVASPRFTDVCELTIVPEQDALKHGVPGLRYQFQCPRQLFSVGCGLRHQDWEVLVDIAGVSGLQVTASAFGSHPDGYFTGGWLDDGHTGMAIEAHSGSSVTLFRELPGLAVGDRILAYPGCQRTEECCHTRFNNLVNHLGFRRIPPRNPWGSSGIA